MKTGDIIFLRGNSFISKLIQFFDRGKYSHVAIAISDNEIVEAQYYTRCRKVPFYFEEGTYDIIDLHFNEYEKQQIIQICNDSLGKWYDYPQIAWYLFKKLFHFKKGNVLNSPNNYICSELIFYILIELGRIKGKEISSDVTPNELYNYLTRLKDVG